MEHGRSEYIYCRRRHILSFRLFNTYIKDVVIHTKNKMFHITKFSSLFLLTNNLDTESVHKSGIDNIGINDKSFETKLLSKY